MGAAVAVFVETVSFVASVAVCTVSLFAVDGACPSDVVVATADDGGGFDPTTGGAVFLRFGGRFKLALAVAVALSLSGLATLGLANDVIVVDELVTICNQQVGS